MQKRISVKCYGPIAAGKQFRSAWEDVWLKWKAKPGRKVYQCGPCLISYPDIVGELEFWRELVIKNVDKPKRKDWYTDDIKHHEAVIKHLETNKYFADSAIDHNGVPNIYTKNDYIDREEAENMIKYFLESQYNINNPKFIWRRTNFYVIPTGYSNLTAG